MISFSSSVRIEVNGLFLTQQGGALNKLDKISRGVSKKMHQISTVYVCHDTLETRAAHVRPVCQRASDLLWKYDKIKTREKMVRFFLNVASLLRCVSD